MLHIAIRDREPRRERVKSMYIVRALYSVQNVWRMTCLFCILSWGRILGRNPEKSVKSLPPCSSQSALQLCPENSISSDSHNLLQFILYTVKEKGGKPDRKPYPLFYGLRNPYRKLKSENSQDYDQKSQRNCTFMNSASGQQGNLPCFKYMYSCHVVLLCWAMPYWKGQCHEIFSSGFFHEPSSPSSGWSQKCHFKFQIAYTLKRTRRK